MPAYVGAIDQGTTSSRFIVFDRDGAMVSVAQREHAQIYPAPGHVEHDPEEIWRNTQAVIADALAAKGLAPSDLAAVGITNQRETTLLWDRRTGRPLHNALVWQDTRVDTLVAALARDGGKDRLRGKTGLPLASYFSGLKLKWLLDHVPEARAKAEAGDALFGTIDSWLVWNLTGGPGKGLHITDVTNASRTQLMDLATLAWDAEILTLFGIPPACLPDIRSSSEVYAVSEKPLAGVAIAGILGDQQAALVGQACFSPGEAKNTYGTGCFMLMNTGTDAVHVDLRPPDDACLQIRRAKTGLCARRLDRHHRRAGAMAARQSLPLRDRARRSRRWRRASPTMAASSSCRRSRASTRPTGTRRRAGSSAA